MAQELKEVAVIDESKKWFDVLSNDVVSSIKKAKNKSALEIQLTDKEKEIVANHAASVRAGSLSGVPIRCPGATTCKMSSDCPLAALEKEPLGDPCPIEKELLIGNTRAYLEEYRIDPLKEYGKYTLVMSLARYDVYIRRSSAYLANPETADVIQNYIIGLDQNNEPIETKDMNKIFIALKYFEDQRLKIIKELVGTSKEQYKKEATLKLAQQTPASAVHISKIKQVADSIYEKLYAKSEETIIDIPPSDTPSQ